MRVHARLGRRNHFSWYPCFACCILLFIIPAGSLFDGLRPPPHTPRTPLPPHTNAWRQGATEDEWRELLEAADAIKESYPDLHEEMCRNSCMLVMEYIPGRSLVHSVRTFR